MRSMKTVFVSTVVFCCLAAAGLVTPVLADQAAVIEEALSAAPADLAKGATVKDWEGNVLKEGDNGWTCLPTTPDVGARGGANPMCNDAVWMEWADAYLNKKDYAGGKFGVSYMLAGDGGASNIDPYPEGPTDDNQWIVEGPHLMLLVSDLAALEGMSTDPWNGGPYVMWKGTPYVHIMVPVDSE